MNRVRIIGAGITGLSAAWRLRSLEIPFELFEASSRVGGVIRTRAEEGFLIESGPNTILETSQEVTNLIRELDLEHRRMYPSGFASNRYVVHHEVPVPLPRGLMQAAATPLLSLSGKFRVMAEPFVAPAHADADETLASFVARRFGRDLLDAVIDPFVAGIYAGSPSELSVRHAFPKLYALEREYRSVIVGAVRGRRKRARNGETSKAAARMFSFDRGLDELPRRLYECMRESIHLNHPVSEVIPDATNPVLICAPAPVVANLLKGLDVLRTVRYAPIARVALGFRRDQVGHALDGFGVLVPGREPFDILGVFFSSSLFPGRAPEGHVLMTVFLGGSRHPRITEQTPEEITEIAIRDVRRLLGVSGHPVYADVEVTPRAIPQYTPGFGDIKAAMTQLETSCPGLFFAGSWRDGVSVSDCIVAGFRKANQVAEYVLNGSKNRTAAGEYRVA